MNDFFFVDHFCISIIFFFFEDIPNVLIISPSSSDQGTTFDLITFQFVGRYDSSTPRYLDTFNMADEKFTQNADLFPDKFSNLQGRIMIIALFNYSPYAFWKEVVRK